jgi:hypothetical protein
VPRVLLATLTLIAAPAAAQPAPPPDTAPVGGDLEAEEIPEAASEPVAEPADAAAPATAAPAPATAVDTTATPTPSSTTAGESPVVSVGGYVQPQFMYRQDDELAPEDEDGFRLRRARLTAGAKATGAGLDVAVKVEAELSPEFQLLDGYVTVARAFPYGVRLAIDAGQVKAPFSRQELLSDANLQFVDKAQIAALAPDRQIGGRVAVSAPTGPVWVELAGGMFNGDGRNQLQNIDEDYLFTGRLAVGYGSRDRALAESDLDDATYAIVAGSAGRNVLASGDASEKQILLGADIAAGWRGVSVGFEYLTVHHFFTNSEVGDYHANGFAAQAGYLLPFRIGDSGRLEIAARVEEIDRNDTVPIEMPGDPNQSLRLYTGAISFYLRGHAAKAQLAYSHVQEVEDVDRTRRDATYGNDNVLLQLTYKLE